MAANEILFNRKIVFIYTIPEDSLSKYVGKSSASGWNINNPDWKGEMTVVSTAGTCSLKFDNSDGTPYGRTFINKYPTVSLQAVTDSSRYFVIVIQLKKSVNNSDSAKVGLGFFTREDSKAFLSSIQEYFDRRPMYKRSAAKMNNQQNEKRPRLPFTIEISSKNQEIGKRSFEIPSRYPCDSRMDPDGRRFSRFAMSLSPSETQRNVVQTSRLPSQSPCDSRVDPDGRRFSRFAMSLSPSETQRNVVQTSILPSQSPCDSRMDPDGRRFSRFAMSLSPPPETQRNDVRISRLPSQSKVPALPVIDPILSFKRVCNLRNLKCPSKSCFRNFKYEFQRRRHELEMHECVCPCCHSAFKKQKNLLKHIELAHRQAVQDRVVSVKCQECGDQFLTQTEYKIHLPLHQHSSKLTCPFCDPWNFSFSNELSKNLGLEQYDFHLKQAHPGLFLPAQVSEPNFSMEYNHNLTRGDLNCGLCSATFHYEFQRRHHVRAQHEGTVRCPRCPFLTNNRLALYGHVLQIHRREVQDRILDVGCGDCSNRFLTRTEYEIHLPVHQNTTLTCPFCNQWMVSATDMISKKWGLHEYDQHLLRNHPQVFEAEKFIWKPDLSATQSKAKAPSKKKNEKQPNENNKLRSEKKNKNQPNENNKLRPKKKKKKQPNGKNKQLYIPKLTSNFNWREFLLQPEVVPNISVKTEVNVPVVPPAKAKPTTSSTSGQQVFAGIRIKMER